MAMDIRNGVPYVFVYTCKCHTLYHGMYFLFWLRFQHVLIVGYIHKVLILDLVIDRPVLVCIPHCPVTVVVKGCNIPLFKKKKWIHKNKNESMNLSSDSSL